MYTKCINEQVFNTMNLLVKEGDTKRLKKWLSECNEEIERRLNQNENIYPLQHEKRYLETLVSS